MVVVIIAFLIIVAVAVAVGPSSSSSSNAARRYDDGCHVSRPLCLLHARLWLRMPMRLLHVLPQCRHM